MGNLKKGTGDPVVRRGGGGSTSTSGSRNRSRGSSAAPLTSRYPKGRPSSTGSYDKGMPSAGPSSYSKGMPSAGPKKSTKAPKSGSSTKKTTPKKDVGGKKRPKSRQYFSKSTGGPKKKRTGPMRFSAKK